MSSIMTKALGQTVLQL